MIKYVLIPILVVIILFTTGLVENSFSTELRDLKTIISNDEATKEYEVIPNQELLVIPLTDINSIAYYHLNTFDQSYTFQNVTVLEGVVNEDKKSSNDNDKKVAYPRVYFTITDTWIFVYPSDNNNDDKGSNPCTPIEASKDHTCTSGSEGIDYSKPNNNDNDVSNNDYDNIDNWTDPPVEETTESNGIENEETGQQENTGNTEEQSNND
jgi:hypothetical protein